VHDTQIARESSLHGGSAFAPDWARTLVDPRAFADEQRRLAGVWTFLGFTSDLAKDGDWFRASLATRSVFVQRFGAMLKSFENVCAHRFYPLRTGDKGNGPIVCGFHGWRYDSDGCAIGIPKCQEQFGIVSRALGASLTPVEIATCGALVFGRFASERPGESLAEFLGTAFPILAALSRSGGPPPQMILTPVAANWKLSVQITLDDYHGVAVHPTTIGRKGYADRAALSYVRFGLHSALLITTEPQALEKMADACASGSYRANHYCIFQILPNLVVSLFRSDGAFFHCCIQQFVPLAHDRSLHRASVHPTAFPVHHPWPTRWTRPFSDPVRRRLIWREARRIMREDHEACEHLQLVAHQVDRAPLLSLLEERVGWFEESYSQLMAEDAVGRRTPATLADEA
jgi:phenylpropionate dioxygenase-like ring-hydroxylating dioxygenase large terminal subunit